MDKTTPELPGYEFVAEIAGGGTSTVWTARQLSLDRIVAVKILASDRTLDPEAMRQFRHEAMAAARLKDPGIVQIFDAGEYADIAYIVMEHIPGGTVQQQLEHRERLPEEETLAVAQWVALALRYAWKECRIIHCDVKPSNVIVSEAGDIKITDLGIAQFVNSMTQAINSREFVCTPNYASPEHITGKVELDCRTDIYSLGAMLYQLVTGKIPFKEYPPHEVLEQQLLGHLEDPRLLAPDLSDSTTAVIVKMMARSLDDRYRDWDEVIADLRALRKGFAPPNASCPPGHSTVQLSSPLALPDPEPPAKTITPSGDNGDKRRVTVKRDHIEHIQKTKRHDRGAFPWGCLLFFLLFAAGLAAAILFTPLRDAASPYLDNARAYIDYYFDNQARTQDDAEPTAPTVYTHEVLGTASQSAPAQPDQLAARHPERDTQQTAGPESNPDYRRGISLYKEARALYDQYHNGNRNAQLLIDAETNCREAIEAFRLAKSRLPNETAIQKQIDNCFHLISDCHHSRQLEL
jgi:serine/threonine protein kinase